MKIETLEKGIHIKKQIDGAEKQQGELHSLYRKRSELTEEEIERLFKIASDSNHFAVTRLKDDLDKL